jgi:hypothetical protein
MSSIAEAPPQTDEETRDDTPPAEGDGLFDRSQYEREDLAIPKVDNQPIDKIAVKFAGRVMLDRSDPADVALFNKLVLGKEVELRCSGKVSRVGTGWATNREGDLDAVVGERQLHVDSVWVLSPEEC